MHTHRWFRLRSALWTYHTWLRRTNAKERKRKRSLMILLFFFILSSYKKKIIQIQNVSNFSWYSSLLRNCRIPFNKKSNCNAFCDLMMMFFFWVTVVVVGLFKRTNLANRNDVFGLTYSKYPNERKKKHNVQHTADWKKATHIFCVVFRMTKTNT